MIKNRFFKSTLGFFAELAIASRIDNSNAGAQQTTLAAFVAAAGNNGQLGIFWADDNTAVTAAGATGLAANAKRSIFYAWKQADGSLKRTTPIPVAGLKYSSQVYNAGTAQVGTVTFNGTYSASQWIHVKVLETTGTQLPFPAYQYSVKVGSGGINQAVTDLATQINAEASANSPIVTASGAAAVLTLTCTDKVRNFKVVAQLETSVAQPSDLSDIVVNNTATKQVYPIGDVASVKELEAYFIQNSGGVIYTPNTYVAADLGLPASNIDGTGATQYGFVIVANDRVEGGGVMEPKVNQKAYAVIAIRSADVATLAGL